MNFEPVTWPRSTNQRGGASLWKRNCLMNIHEEEEVGARKRMVMKVNYIKFLPLNMQSEGWKFVYVNKKFYRFVCCIVYIPQSIVLRTKTRYIWPVLRFWSDMCSKMAISFTVMLAGPVNKCYVAILDMSFVVKQAEIFQYNMIFEVTGSQVRGPLRMNTINIESLTHYGVVLNCQKIVTNNKFLDFVIPCPSQCTSVKNFRNSQWSLSIRPASVHLCPSGIIPQRN